MPDLLYASLPPKGETVSDCVIRLGPPPDDIASEWIDEAIELTGQEDLTSFDPEAELWRTIYVGTDGRLHTDQPNSVQLSVVSSEDTTEASTSDTTDDDNRLGWSRWFLLSLACVVVVGLGWWLFSTTNDAKVASRSIVDRSTMSLPGTPPEPRMVRSQPSTEPVTLMEDSDGGDEELELVIDELDAFAVSRPAGLGMELSLDDFLPPSQPDLPSNASKPTESAPGKISEKNNEPSPPTALDEPLANDFLSDDDEEDPSEMLEEADEQSTTRRDPIEPQVTGALLPSPPRRSESSLPEAVLLLSPGRLPDSIDLQMPSSSTAKFQLRPSVTSPSSWQVTSGKEANPIATLFGDPNNNELQFKWLDDSREVSSASTLAQGRLRTSDGDVVYLRPRLDTEAIKLTLAKRDVKLKWNLQTPIPPRATEIRVSANVPKDVELQWIEPIVSTSPRGTRGVALLRLKTSDDTAIVVRMDIKTTTSLSLRLRFGARLDPTMPWQWTDAQSIRDSFEAVTKQLEFADAQLLNLDVAISRAERIRARRQEYLLEDQRDRIDEAVKGWTTVAKRLAELDQLVAFLDAGASLSPELIVRWDDGDQVVLGVPVEPTADD